MGVVFGERAIGMLFLGRWLLGGRLWGRGYRGIVFGEGVIRVCIWEGVIGVFVWGRGYRGGVLEIGL